MEYLFKTATGPISPLRGSTPLLSKGAPSSTLPPVYGSSATQSTALAVGKLRTPREPGTSSARGIPIDVPSVQAVEPTGTCTYTDNSCEGTTCEDDTSESDMDQPNMEQATRTFIYMLLSISGMQYSA